MIGLGSDKNGQQADQRILWKKTFMEQQFWLDCYFISVLDRGGGAVKKVTLHECNFGHLVVADSVKLFSLGTIIIDFFYVFISRPLTGL